MPVLRNRLNLYSFPLKGRGWEGVKPPQAKGGCSEAGWFRRALPSRIPTMQIANIPVEIGKGDTLRCQGWRQEGILRMLENTVHNGEKPQELIIYGGSGRAARNWDSFLMPSSRR